MEEKVFKTCCWECFNHCGILAHVKDGRVVKVEGNPEHPYNRGFMCVKGHHMLDNMYHPDRLLFPLKKVKGGWERISWGDALEVISAKLEQVIRNFSPLSVCGASAHTDAYMAGMSLSLFLRSIGSPNMFSNSDVCTGLIQVADQITVGDRETSLKIGGGAAAGPFDFENTNCLFILGGQIEASFPSQWKFFTQAKKRGAKVIVADPRYTKTASQADLYLQIRPGTDCALALGMLNVVINEGLYDNAFVNKWCSGFGELKDRVQDYPPEKVEKITWIPAEKIKLAAHMYAETKPACISPRTGSLHNINGTQTVRALGSMAAICGNIDVPGGNPLAKHLPGFTSTTTILRAKEFRLPPEIEEKALGASSFPLWTGPTSKLFGDIHNPSGLDAMITGKPYPLKAMIITGVNILSTYPDSRKVLEALKKLELLVVNAWYMTPTAEFADIILPKTHSLETDDIAIYMGMHKAITVCQKVVEPLGEAWDDMKIFTELRKRLEWKGLAQRKFLPWEGAEDYLRYLLKNTGFTLEEFREKGFIPIPQDPWKKYETPGFRFPTQSGKIESLLDRTRKTGV